MAPNFSYNTDTSRFVRASISLVKLAVCLFIYLLLSFLHAEELLTHNFRSLVVVLYIFVVSSDWCRSTFTYAALEHGLHVWQQAIVDGVWDCTRTISRLLRPASCQLALLLMRGCYANVNVWLFSFHLDFDLDSRVVACAWSSLYAARRERVRVEHSHQAREGRRALHHWDTRGHAVVDQAAAYWLRHWRYSRLLHNSG